MVYRIKIMDYGLDACILTLFYTQHAGFDKLNS